MPCVTWTIVPAGALRAVPSSCVSWSVTVNESSGVSMTAPSAGVTIAARGVVTERMVTAVVVQPTTVIVAAPALEGTEVATAEREVVDTAADRRHAAREHVVAALAELDDARRRGCERRALGLGEVDLDDERARRRVDDGAVGRRDDRSLLRRHSGEREVRRCSPRAADEQLCAAGVNAAEVATRERERVARPHVCHAACGDRCRALLEGDVAGRDRRRVPVGTRKSIVAVNVASGTAMTAPSAGVTKLALAAAPDASRRRP